MLLGNTETKVWSGKRQQQQCVLGKALPKSVLEDCAWGRSEYKPKVCFKEKKNNPVKTLKKKGNLIMD